MNLTILQAESDEHIRQLRELLLEYGKSLDFHLCFQQFQEELASLPGAYVPPEGRILLAACGGEPAGCVALRKVRETVGEMKRLYVRPAFRGHGIGRALVLGLLAQAREAGYARIQLDTLPAFMKEAMALYESLGFRRTNVHAAASAELVVVDMELVLGASPV